MSHSYEWILEANGINKSYTRGLDDLHILKGLDIRVRHGEAVSIVGPSGSGKSTLLQILGTLDRPNSGTLEILGHDVLLIDDHELAKYRNEKMGFVFQFHHLLSEFDALENVALPLRIAGIVKKEALEKAAHWLDIVGLKDRNKHFPNQLSGGELQRVAIARALVRQPRILFADEPTGNLDSKNSRSIQDLFFSLRDQLKLTLIVVTHDMTFAEKFSRIMRLADGQWLGSPL